MEEKEYIDVVDENGVPTGEVLDKNIVHEKNLFHNEVGCFIINNKGETLMQKRAASKKFEPNMWAICAGHVGSGESFLDAMVREIREEVGLVVRKEDLIAFPGFEKIIFKKQKNSHFAYTYYLKLSNYPDEFIIQKEELSEVKWMKIDEVINIIKSDNNITVFDIDRLPIFEKIKEL